MTETPSARRRKGREAFVPDCDPMDVQPYTLRSWIYIYHLKDWLEGWKEAKETYEAQKKDEEVQGMVDPNWTRILPLVQCPFCGKGLKEMREKRDGWTTLSWVCDCSAFKATELEVNK